MAKTATVAKSTFTNSLENTISYAERQRLTALSVLREGIGQLKARQARVEGQEFDWSAFKAQFNRDYGSLDLKQLIALNRKYLGLNDMDAINHRYQAHQKQYRSRQQRISA